MLSKAAIQSRLFQVLVCTIAVFGYEKIIMSGNRPLRTLGVLWHMARIGTYWIFAISLT